MRSGNRLVTQRSVYDAPRLNGLGSVGVLTASGFKCTGGSDAFYADMRAGMEPADGGVVYDPITGEVIDADGCEPFTVTR